MLILTRKAGESLYIGDDIRLTVLGIQGKQIKLGLTLPDTMSVYREEIYNLVADDNALAKKAKQDKIKESDLPKTYEMETRLGKQEIDESKIVHFPKGLIGYEKEDKFTILHLAEGSPFYMLQSVQTPDLGLIVVDPYIFLDDYSIKINDSEQKTIDVTSSEDVFIFVTVTVPHGKPELTTLNLSGPIFVNFEKRLALQIPQDVKVAKVLVADCIKAQETDDKTIHIKGSKS